MHLPVVIQRQGYLEDGFQETSERSTNNQKIILPNQTDHIIKDLGNKAMNVMFGNDGSSNLETLRYNTLVKKNTTAKSIVHPERLRPTSSSTKFLCLRVYYQIVVWTGTDDGMNALEWRWKVDNNQMVPIMTDMKAALTTY